MKGGRIQAFRDFKGGRFGVRFFSWGEELESCRNFRPIFMGKLVVCGGRVDTNVIMCEDL